MDNFQTNPSQTEQFHSQDFSKAPKSKQWNIMTLNVENLKSLGEHFILTQITLQFSIDILCIQETHITAHNDFQYQGFRFLLSGDTENKHAGVGFIINPRVNKYIKAFKPINARIAILKLNTSPRPIWDWRPDSPNRFYV